MGGGIIEVIWTGGDAELGGDDFDRALAAFLAARHARTAGPSAAAALAADRPAAARLVAAARRARERLSSAREVEVLLGVGVAGAEGGKETLTLRDLETACSPLLDRLTAPVRQARAPRCRPLPYRKRRLPPPPTPR